MKSLERFELSKLRFSHGSRNFSEFVFTLTYPLRAKWHIRPQHSVSTLPCRWLRPVLHPTFSIHQPVFPLDGSTPYCLRSAASPFPSGANVIAFRQSSSVSFLRTWPMYFHRFLRALSLMLSIPALSTCDLISNMLLPSYLQYPLSEDVQFLLISLRHLPRLRAMHQNGLYQGLEQS